MLGLIAKGLGTTAILYLAYLGADRVVSDVFTWKRAYDKQRLDGTSQTLIQ